MGDGKQGAQNVQDAVERSRDGKVRFEVRWLVDALVPCLDGFDGQKIPEPADSGLLMPTVPLWHESLYEVVTVTKRGKERVNLVKFEMTQFTLACVSWRLSTKSV